MTFWQLLLRVLPWAPLRAIEALWWHATRRRVRALNILCRAAMPLPFAYEYWQKSVEPHFEPSGVAEPDRWPWRPTFSLILAAEGGDCEPIRATINSLRRQTYPAWTCLVLAAVADEESVPLDSRVQWSPPSSLAPINAELMSAIQRARGDAVLVLGKGTELSPSALLELAHALQANPNAAIVYGDQDTLDAAGRRRNPWFKGDWNEELFLALDYLSDAAAMASKSAQAAVAELAPDASLYELLLRIGGQSGRTIVHVPRIIAHVRHSAAHANVVERRKVVHRFVALEGGTAELGPFETVKAVYPLPSPAPLVSIVIPTKDKLNLLQPCVESVLAKTRYEPFEILVMDNGSREDPTLRYLAELATDPHVRVISHPHPYNYSAINNHAARQARGEYLCLLNNDTEVIGAEWLTELMRYAVRPNVGAVGAKLLYEDRTIQHAGVVVGIGEAAGHAHRNLPHDHPGYFCSAHVAQFVTAVTGACLLVSRDKFLDVGGLDEERLAIAYNDVDLCLKLEQAGWRNVYVPHAVLIHYESRSRGKDHSPSQIDRYTRELRTFQERWGAKAYADPSFNPNLDPNSESFVFRLSKAGTQARLN